MQSKLAVPLMMNIALLSLVSLACPIALAQSSSGYVVAGIGSGGGKRNSQWVLGGEFVIRRSIGVGGEIGAVAGHDTFAVLSVQGYYHLPVSNPKKADVFATAGYTRGVAWPLGPGRNLLGIGGGLVYWFHSRIGLRMEFRDLLPHPGSNIDRPAQLYGFRAGIALR